MAEVATGAVASPEPIALTKRGAIGLAQIQRKGRLNALNQEMLAGLKEWYPPLAREPGIYAVVIRSGIDGVFSVGGDVRQLLEIAAQDVRAARAALASELALLWLHECFSKPTVALIDGLVMGSGVGITLYGTHRVAGEKYRFRMPETGIGYFPDCGLAHAFARMPGGIGMYLGLTGADVGPADALALDLVTHIIPSPEHDAIEACLADADPVDPVLDVRHREPGAGPLMAEKECISHYFTARSVAEILARLEQPRSEDRDWAAATLAMLRSRSPLALCLTFRAIERAVRLDIRETLIQDYRLAHRLIESADFREGATAVLIDKGRQPRWQHSRVEEVPASLIDAHFESLGSDELELPSRAEMQAARV